MTDETDDGRETQDAEPLEMGARAPGAGEIGLQYRIQNPGNTVFLGNRSLVDIMDEGKLGNPDRLPTLVKLLQPDITDTTVFVLFEIKPDNERGLEEGREQAGRYLAALNAAVDPGKALERGTGYEGSLFVEFENGGAPEMSWEERAAQKEEEIPEEELEKHAQIVERAIQNAYDGGERPVGFQGQVYRPVDCH